MSERKESPKRSAMQVARDRASQRIGQSIHKKWTIDSLVGVGGMASVYAATHRNGSRVALKILHPEFARDPGVKKRFLREGYVANKVDHPGVVSILDDDETEQGEPLLVMELLEGETLQQLWKRRNRKVPVPEALHIAQAILDTLIPFHGQNIIHRDLKPANIFITHAGDVKLLDFGVAQLRETGQAMTRAGTALGTPSYMSPEQAMGKSKQLDGRSDIFSVGATLFAILSGKRLHHGRSDNEAFILAATQPAPSIARRAPELPLDVVALVDKSMQWDRRKRYGNAEEMRDACREVLRGQAQDDADPPAAAGSAAPSRSQRPAPSPEPARATGSSAAGGQPSPRSARARTTGSRTGNAHSPTPRPVQPRSGPPPLSLPPQPDDAPVPMLDEAFAGAAGASQAPAAAAQADPEPVPQSILDIFDRLERAMPTLRQYGFDHREADNRVRGIFRAVVDALRDVPEGISWSVHPYCFAYASETLWEPSPPHDRIPYVLAAAGVEEISILPGIDADELGVFLQIATSDPTSGADADIAAALWEARFTHMHFKIRDDFADADAAAQARFYAEADDLEAMAHEDLAEVAAMAVATETADFHDDDGAKALQLDVAARTALNRQISTDISRWRTRYFELLVDAFEDATLRGDVQLVLKPLMNHAQQLLRRERYQELFATHRALLDNIGNHRMNARHPNFASTLSAWMFPTAALNNILKKLGAPESADPAHDEMMLAGAERVFEVLPSRLALEILKLANRLPEGPARTLALSYVDRSIAGNEAELVEMMDHLRPELAQHVLGALVKAAGDQSSTVLQPLLKSSNRALRCEAMALLSGDNDDLGKQLLLLLDAEDKQLRDAAMMTLVRHTVRNAGPGLVKILERDDFKQRAASEQETMFEVLFHLHGPRAEALLTTVLGQHGLMADETADRTRIIAARLLGKHADGPDPLQALESATRRRPWNTQPLRAAAEAARALITTRLHQKRAARHSGAPPSSGLLS